MKHNEDKKYVVYCHTNKINGKKYIGITCQELNQRFRNGKGYKSSPHFNNAIKKYGWSNFEHEILFSDLDEKTAKEREVEMISQYKTRNTDYGYNVTPGGEGYSGSDSPWFGKHHTEEAKRKMSESRKGIPKPDGFGIKISAALKGRVFSKETKDKMKDNHYDCSGKNNPMYGKKLSKEHIEKLNHASKSKEAIEKMKKNKIWYSGAQNPNARCVICLDTGKVYETVKEASIDTGCSMSKISAVCHGKRKHTGNLHFQIIEDD